MNKKEGYDVDGRKMSAEHEHGCLGIHSGVAGLGLRDGGFMLVLRDKTIISIVELGIGAISAKIIYKFMNKEIVYLMKYLRQYWNGFVQNG